MANLSAVHEPASNTAAIATLTNGKSYTIAGIMCHWSYDGNPTGGSLTIKSGSTTLSVVSITNGGPGFLPLAGFQTAENENLSATLAAGGVGITGKVAISGAFL